MAAPVPTREIHPSDPRRPWSIGPSMVHVCIPSRIWIYLLSKSSLPHNHAHTTPLTTLHSTATQLPQDTSRRIFVSSTLLSRSRNRTRRFLSCPNIQRARELRSKSKFLHRLRRPSFINRHCRLPHTLGCIRDHTLMGGRRQKKSSVEPVCVAARQRLSRRAPLGCGAKVLSWIQQVCLSGCSLQGLRRNWLRGLFL